MYRTKIVCVRGSNGSPGHFAWDAKVIYYHQGMLETTMGETHMSQAVRSRIGPRLQKRTNYLS